jgi:hypothetical protein
MKSKYFALHTKSVYPYHNWLTEIYSSVSIFRIRIENNAPLILFWVHAIL